jgi:hypothetical protein
MLVTNIGHVAHISVPAGGVWCDCDMKGGCGKQSLAMQPKGQG